MRKWEICGFGNNWRSPRFTPPEKPLFSALCMMLMRSSKIGSLSNFSTSSAELLTTMKRRSRYWLSITCLIKVMVMSKPFQFTVTIPIMRTSSNSCWTNSGSKVKNSVIKIARLLPGKRIHVFYQLSIDEKNHTFWWLQSQISIERVAKRESSSQYWS